MAFQIAPRTIPGPGASASSPVRRLPSTMGGSPPGGAERAYAAGVPRVFRPEVAVAILKAARAKQKKKKKPKYDPSRRPTSEVFNRGSGRTAPVLQTPADRRRTEINRRLRQAYAGQDPTVSRILGTPGAGVAATVGGSPAFGKYAAGGQALVTGGEFLLDRVNRLGAPAAALVENWNRPGRLPGALGTSLKRQIDTEPYKTLSDVLPKSGNPWIDIPAGLAGDIATNPASFVTRPIATPKTIIADAIRAAQQGRYLGRTGQAGGAYLPGLVRQARPPQLFNPMAGPDLPVGRLDVGANRQVGRRLSESPYPLGVSNRAAYQPDKEMVQQLRPHFGLFSNQPMVRDKRTAAARALTTPRTGREIPAPGSLNRLRQRAAVNAPLYGRVTGQGSKTTLGRAFRTGTRRGAAGVNLRVQAGKAANRVNRKLGSRPVPVRTSDRIGTQVPGLVGTRTRASRFQQAFTDRPKVTVPGARLPGGATSAGNRPRLRFPLRKGSYKGQSVNQVERYQVVKTAEGWRVRDSGQRKFFAQTYKTEKEAIDRAMDAASRRVAPRAAGLQPKRGLPPRVQPRDVPYPRRDLSKLQGDLDNATDRFRSAMRDRVKAGDLPRETAKRIGRLVAAIDINQSDLLRLQKKIAVTRRTQRSAGEVQRLLNRRRDLERKLDRTMDKLAQAIGSAEGGRKVELIRAYKEMQKARDELRGATQEISRTIGQRRQALRAQVARKPGGPTRESTEGQKALLRPDEPVSGQARPPVPEPVANVDATVKQILDAPYPLKATVAINKLRGRIAKLEGQYAEFSGLSKISLKRSSRIGQQQERLNRKIIEAENAWFVDQPKVTWTPPKDATFAQKKVQSQFFHYSELTDMAIDIMRAENQVIRRMNEIADTGYFIRLPGLGVSFRLPSPTSSTMKLLEKHEPEAARLMRTVHEQGRDMFVTRYGPNKAVGAAARSLDSSVQTSNTDAWDTIYSLTHKYKVSKADQKKATHWLETGKYDDELSDSAKKWATELQQFVESHTNEYIQAGGDLKRLAKSYVFHMFKPKDWDEARLEQLMVEPQSFVFGNLPKFTKARPDPKATVEQLIKDGFDMEENLAYLTYARVAAHNRSMADLSLSRAVSRTFGTKARRSANDIEVKTEFIDPSKVKVQFGRPGEQVVVNDVVRDVFKLDKGIFIPYDVGQTLLKMQYIRQANARNAFKKLRTANARWKSWALMTTGYDIRNQIGDMMLMSQSGLQPIQSVVRGIFMLRARDKVARTAPQFISDTAKRAVGKKPAPRQGPTYRQLRNEADRLGVGQRGVLPQDVDAALAGAGSQTTKVLGGKQANIPSRRGVTYRARRARVGRENLNRYGAFAQQVTSRKRGSLYAAKRTNEGMFDYGDVGSLVQALRTSPLGMPFVTWLAKNIPAQVKRLPTRGNVAYTSANKQLAAESQDPELGYPSFANQANYFAERSPLPIPGIGFATAGFPQADLNRVAPVVNTPSSFTGSLQELTSKWSGDLAPAVQLALASMAARNIYTGQELGLGAKSPATPIDKLIANLPLPGLGTDYKRVMNEQGKYEWVPSVGAFQKTITNTLLPPLGNLSRITGSEQVLEGDMTIGPTKINARQLAAIFGGVGTSPFWNRRQTQQFLTGAKFDHDDAKSKLNKEIMDLTQGTGTKQFVKSDPATKMIVKWSDPRLKPYVDNYNRTLSKYLELNRIFKVIKNRG